MEAGDKVLIVYNCYDFCKRTDRMMSLNLAVKTVSRMDNEHLYLENFDHEFIISETGTVFCHYRKDCGFVGLSYIGPHEYRILVIEKNEAVELLENLKQMRNKKMKFFEQFRKYPVILNIKNRKTETGKRFRNSNEFLSHLQEQLNS